jgi:bifunctional DNA-binding transcriptional regulator/antitoxin component of YhaV-PrlF toxin-antitoxin module
MTALSVTAKGQVTLRKDLLAHLGVQPGQKIDAAKLPDGRIEIRAIRGRSDISEIFGLAKREDGPVLSIEQMNEIIRKGWAGEL